MNFGEMKAQALLHKIFTKKNSSNQRHTQILWVNWFFVLNERRGQGPPERKRERRPAKSWRWCSNFAWSHEWIWMFWEVTPDRNSPQFWEFSVEKKTEENQDPNDKKRNPTRSHLEYIGHPLNANLHVRSDCRNGLPSLHNRHGRRKGRGKGKRCSGWRQLCIRSGGGCPSSGKRRRNRIFRWWIWSREWPCWNR